MTIFIAPKCSVVNAFDSASGPATLVDLMKVTLSEMIKRYTALDKRFNKFNVLIENYLIRTKELS